MVIIKTTLCFVLRSFVANKKSMVLPCFGNVNGIQCYGIYHSTLPSDIVYSIVNLVIDGCYIFVLVLFS